MEEDGKIYALFAMNAPIIRMVYNITHQKLITSPIRSSDLQVQGTPNMCKK